MNADLVSTNGRIDRLKMSGKMIKKMPEWHRNSNEGKTLDSTFKTSNAPFCVRVCATGSAVFIEASDPVRQKE